MNIERRAFYNLVFTDPVDADSFLKALEGRARKLALKGSSVEERFGEHIYYVVRDLRADLKEHRKLKRAFIEEPFHSTHHIELRMPEVKAWLHFIGDSESAQLARLREAFDSERLQILMQLSSWSVNAKKISNKRKRT